MIITFRLNVYNWQEGPGQEELMKHRTLILPMSRGIILVVSPFTS